MKTLYLIRHGEPAFPNGEKLCIGRLELPLSDAGWRQGNALALWLGDKNISKVYTSPCLRAKQTAQCIRPDAEPVSGLEEIDMGLWEGMSFAQIHTRFPARYEARGKDIVHVPPPEGESFANCLFRVQPIFNRILKAAPESLAVVAHAGVNRVMLCAWQGIDLGRVLEIPQPYGCINIVQFTEKGPDVISVAEMPLCL